MKRLTMIVDNLVANSPVVRLLQERGVQITTSNLAAGHYFITDKCGILQVEAEEFGRWTAEKTVFRHITEFKRAVNEPVIVLQGPQPPDSHVVSPSALRGALAFVAVHNRVPILFAADANETADLLYAMANQVQNGMGQTVAAPISPSAVERADEVNGGNGDAAPEVTPDLPEHIVRMLPYVGPVTAKALLRRFGNLRALFSASATDLTKIDGIGPKKAKKIVAFFAGKSVR